VSVICAFGGDELIGSVVVVGDRNVIVVVAVGDASGTFVFVTLGIINAGTPGTEN